LSEQQTEQEVLAGKVRLLLDIFRRPDGKELTFPEIETKLAERGVSISRSRWQRLLAGSTMFRPDSGLLTALADVFDVDAVYLLKRDAEIDERIEAELALTRSARLAEVQSFAARTLGTVSPDALKELSAILDRYQVEK